VNCQRDRASRLHFRAGGIDTVPCNVTVCRCDTPEYAAERVVAMRAPPAREPMQTERKRKPASRNAIMNQCAARSVPKYARATSVLFVHVLQ
jgi:hypothetical protein